ARLLLGWKESRAHNGATTLKLTLTHDEMAQMIGSSRETVTRMLARFRAKNYIEVHGSTLLIRNRVALQSLADNPGNDEAAEAQAPAPGNGLRRSPEMAPSRIGPAAPRARAAKSPAPMLQLSARAAPASEV